MSEFLNKIKNKACPPWFKIENKGDKKAKIDIYDDIGGGFFFFGLTAKDFRNQLKEIGNVDEIDVFINSNGGKVFEGFAIYEMLNSHSAKINVKIDGIAASIASVIAMAGDSVVMAKNAFMMMHQPKGLFFGKSDELRNQANLLDKIENNIVDTYASRAKIKREEIQNLVKEETWLTADEAIEKGFADELSEEVEVAAFAGDRYGSFNAVPVFIQNLVNREDKPTTVNKDKEDKKDTEDEMTKEEIKAMLDGGIKAAVEPLTTEITGLKTRAETAEKELKEYKEKQGLSTVEDKRKLLVNRVNACVSAGKVTPVERDSAVKIVNKLDEESGEEYVKGLESRNKIANGVLSVEVTKGDGSTKSCVLDKDFTVPTKDNGHKIPHPSAIAAFDSLNVEGESYDDFRKRVYAQAGERVPPKPVVPEKEADVK